MTARKPAQELPDTKKITSEDHHGRSFFTKFTRSKTIKFLSIAILLAAVPVTVLTALHQQDLRQRAADCGATCTQSSPFGKALNTAADSYVDVSPYKIPPFSTTAGPVTVETWIYVKKLSTSVIMPVVIYARNTNATFPDNAIFRLAVSLGGGNNGASIQSRVRIINAKNTSATPQYLATVTQSIVPFETWTHVAVVFKKEGDGCYLRTYINGNLMVTDSNVYRNIVPNCEIDTTDTGHILIGSPIGGDPYPLMNNFWGLIDEVRVSKTARYTNNFTPQMQAFNFDSNTIALYHLNGNANDEGPYARTGTIVRQNSNTFVDSNVSLNGSTTSQSRDAERKADIQSIHKALELYYADHKAYPSTPVSSCVDGDPTKIDCPPQPGIVLNWTNNFGAYIYKYLNPLPVDPINARTSVNFEYIYDGKGGICAFRLEIGTASGGSKGDYCIGPEFGGNPTTRDAQRKVDIQTIHNSLEKYYTDHGSYPTSATVVGSCVAGDFMKVNCPAIADPNAYVAWTNALGGSAYFTNGRAPVDPWNIIVPNRATFSYYYDGKGTVCANRLEIGTGSGGGHGDFCIPPTHQVASAKRVFITSTSYTGNLGGLSGADAKCQTQANAANLGGTWKAWLSDNTTSAASRLNHSTVPYKLLNGSLVSAIGWADLTSTGYIYNPILITEFNTSLSTSPNVPPVFTNTTANGSMYATSTSCNNWTSQATSNDIKAMVGWSSKNTPEWTHETLDNCSDMAHLYCFEQ